MTENLWPVDFGEVKTKTPVWLLQEQANALGQRTTNIVVGRVDSLKPSIEFGPFIVILSTRVGRLPSFSGPAESVKAEHCYVLA